MNSLKDFFHKILSSLFARPLVGGLEVSDQVLRLVYYRHKAWQLAAIRLAPGVMEKGKVKDPQSFAAALHELKLKVPFAKKKKMNVVVSLSSVNMYSQVFSLPKMEGSGFDDAIDLNARMLSPVDVAQTYFGWEIIGDDADGIKSEVAVAFVDKGLVDTVTHALYAAGFITMGVESRALALVRVFRDKGSDVDINKSYLLLDVDNSGVDFLIIRKGRLYFEYATQWEDISDNKGEIPIPKFKEALAADMRQVMNFYTQHWPEPLAAIILAATALRKEAEEAIQSAGAASAPIINMALKMDQQTSSEWMVALGCSLRGADGTLKSKEINLSGAGAIDTFHREQLLNFLSLWRIIIPVVLGCLVVVFIGTDNFLNATKMTIDAEPSFGQEQLAAVDALEASSTAFNQMVALAANAESQVSQNYLLFAEVTKIAAANGITIDQLSFQGATTPVTLSATTQSEDQIAAFKSAIQADPHFGTVNLPLSNVQQESGVYAFSMTFSLATGF